MAGRGRGLGGYGVGGRRRQGSASAGIVHLEMSKILGGSALRWKFALGGRLFECPGADGLCQHFGWIQQEVVFVQVGVDEEVPRFVDLGQMLPRQLR